MRKPTAQSRKWHRLRQRNEARRVKAARERKAYRTNLSPALASQLNIGVGRISVPETGAERPQVINVSRQNNLRLMVPPPDFSLRRSYLPVVSFFQNFRHWIYNGPVVSFRNKGVDFRRIQSITPGAALVLAAELFRWQSCMRQKLRPFSIYEWNPQIYRIFRDFGLFEFLETPSHLKNREDRESPAFKFIKYQRGVDVTPTSCSDLLDHLSAMVGKIEAETFIFDGLVEALNNVKHHAYPKDMGWHGVASGTWLMCGAYSPELKALTAAVYDMGVGIPATLPRSGLWEQIKGWLSRFGANDDSSMIAAAMEAGRSRTGLVQRGKGLPIMMRLFDHTSGQLRIISGHGEIRYRSGAGEIERIQRPLSLGGTLIQWQIAER